MSFGTSRVRPGSQKRYRYRKGESNTSLRPLPSAIHSWHNYSEGMVDTSLVRHDCFWRPRGNTQPKGHMLPSLTFSSFKLAGGGDVAPSSGGLYGGSSMGLHVMMHINNRTCFSLGNANIWCQEKGKWRWEGRGVCTYTVISEDFHASHMSGSVTDYRARECNSLQHDLFGTGVLQRIASRLLCKPQTRLGANEGSTRWNILTSIGQIVMKLGAYIHGWILMKFIWILMYQHLNIFTSYT